jgi:hypothetical protein
MLDQDEAAFDAGECAQFAGPARLAQTTMVVRAQPCRLAARQGQCRFMLAKFKEWGWDARIETFQVLYPTPISTTVELVAPEKIKLGGQEPPVPGDDTSANTADALPPYVAFRATAMSPPTWSTSISACPRITRRSRGAAST